MLDKQNQCKSALSGKSSAQRAKIKGAPAVKGHLISRLGGKIKHLNIFLGLCFCLSIASLLFSLRALHGAGGNNLLEFLLEENWLFHVFSPLISLFLDFFGGINFKASPLFYSSYLPFSFFALQLHQPLCLAGAYIVLPKDKKHLLFFPLFGFLTGPFIFLEEIITSPSAVFSMIWLLFFALKYADFSKIIHLIIIILPLIDLPAEYEHEMVMYMAFPLIALAFRRLKREALWRNKAFLSLIIARLVFAALYTSYFVFFAEKEIDGTGYYKQLLQTVYELGFFFIIKDGALKGLYLPCLLAALLLALPFLRLISSRKAGRAAQIPLTAAMALGFGALLLSSFRSSHGFFPLVTGDEDASKAVFLYFSLPAGLLVWHLFEKKIFTFKDQAVFLLFCLLASFSFAVWNLSLDYRFIQYKKQFTEILSKCQGVMYWPEEEAPPFEPELLNFFHRERQLTSYSIFLPKKYKPKAIFQNEDMCFGFCGGDISNTAIKTEYFDFSGAIQHHLKGESRCRFD